MREGKEGREREGMKSRRKWGSSVVEWIEGEGRGGEKGGERARADGEKKRNKTHLQSNSTAQQAAFNLQMCVGKWKG